MLKKLFIDLDGVLADFDRGVETVTGTSPDRLKTRQMWAALAKAPDFFATLEFMHDAQVLWEFCRPHDPVILTGLPLGDWAAAQKRRWVAARLGAAVPVITCMSRDKHHHSGPGHVLVDDRVATCDSWERRGGIFIAHTSAAQSIAALKRLGL